MNRSKLLVIGLLLIGLNSTALAQVRTYNVRQTLSPPTMDGVVGATEWAAAEPAQGGWGELLQLSPPDLDTANNRFRMTWDATNLYVLYQTDQNIWNPAQPAANPEFSFVDDQLFLYFDPNLDDEPNAVTVPDEFVDGYELAFNQPQGTRVSTNANRSGVGFSTQARVDSIFGDQADWNQGGDPLLGAALGGIVVAQRNGASGGVAEVRIPWTSFNADALYSGPFPTGDYNLNRTVDAADYSRWRDTLGQAVTPLGSGADGDRDGTIDADDYNVWRTSFNTSGDVVTGLNHPFAPTVGDTWFFNIGQVSTADTANLMPVYNWTESFFFAARPHAEITFVGSAIGTPATAVPEPSTLLGISLAAFLIAVERHRTRLRSAANT